MLKLPAPRTNGLLQKLNSDELSYVRSRAVEIELAANDILIDAGTPLDYVHFPNIGLVSLLVVMPDEALAEAGFVGSEGAVGSNYDPIGRKSYTRATVIVRGNALRMPIDDFELMIAESLNFREAVGQNNRRNTERGQQLAACNLLHRLESRLCRWLLQVFDNSGDASAVITQDILAHMLGVNRARLNEALKLLENEGSIVQPGKQLLTIVDVDAIAEKVCRCHGLMRVPTPD